MTRGLYLIITIALFFIAYIPDLISTLAAERILIDKIPRNSIKAFLIFFIAFMESNLIRRQWPGILGWVASGVLLIGIGMHITHLTYARETMLLATLVLIVNLFFHGIKEQNKSLFHYFLIAFIGLRVSIIVFRTNDILWWSDIITGSIISIYGVFLILRKKINPLKNA